MEPYEYQALWDPQRDIRLVTLLPGDFDDIVCINIKHVRLDARTPETPSVERPSLATLRRTLPKGFDVQETREGQLVFHDTVNRKTSWSHPNPGPYPEVYDAVETRRVATVDYTALSYAWGPETDELQHVDVVSSPMSAPTRTWSDSLNPWKNSHALKRSATSPAPKVGSLKVRQNLFSALRHLRDTAESRTFWIDSICINQEDPVEKGLQLKRMTDIYSIAPRTVIWLGESTEDSVVALLALRYIGQQIVITKEGAALPSPDATEPSWYDPDTALSYDSATWDSISGFCQQPYFQRLWIWQEVVLADSRATVQWGEDSVPWLTLQRAILRLFHRASNLPRNMRPLYKHVWMLAALRPNCYFTDLLEMSSDQKCTEPRDKIYGLLGLIKPGLRQRIVPDYTISASDVYKNSFLAFLERYWTLDLLGHCDLQRRSICGPSWVPNWSMKFNTHFFARDAYFAALRRTSTWEYCERDTLKVTGIRTTTVNAVSPHVIAPKYSVDAVAKLRSCIPPDLERSTYITGESLLDAYAITLCAGLIDIGVDLWKRGHPSLANVREGFKRHILNTNGIAISEPMAEAQDDVYVNSVFETARGRSLFTTHDGFVGLGPPGAQPGDVICVIFGCEVPMLLRPNASGSKTGELVVGPAYVHGFMHGEALLGLLPRPWRAYAQHDFLSGLKVPSFSNSDTGEVTLIDPRWPPLIDGEWEMLTERQVFKDNDPTPHFRNLSTREVRSEHPCLLEETLRARGIEGETFSLN